MSDLTVSPSNPQLLDRFYTALSLRDHRTMGACYLPDARFSDPVFGELHGDEVPAMWRMLCERGTDLVVTHSDVETEADYGSARWVASYTFSATGRRVRNEVEAQFRFADGLIAEHDDRFDLWKWTRQALGTTGLLLGWSPPVQGKVRAQARSALQAAMARS